MYFCAMKFLKSLVHFFKSYSVSFWVLCTQVLLFFGSFTMLIPEMNSYITELGGADKKWMILGFWTIAAAITRPFSGKIADNVSRKSVMFIGVIISVIISFSYPLFTTVAGFLLLRFLHGFSSGFHPTGAMALVADIIPQGKRGEAMGIMGVMITLGFSGGQGLGSIVRNAFDMNGLFYTCGILSALSILLIFVVKENKETVKANAAEKGYVKLRDKIIPKRDEIIGPEVIQPSIIMFLSANVAGLYFMMVPDFSEHLGIENKGLFFLVNVVIVVVTRFVAGRFVDLWGARKNLYVSLSVLIIGCVVTGTATTPEHFLGSSLIYGFGAAIGSPAIMAWTADLSNPIYKGRGMATMFIALEVGFLCGNFLAQLIYDNDPNKFLDAFIAGACLSALGVIYLIFTRRKPASSFK
jgi:MFS family permease